MTKKKEVKKSPKKVKKVEEMVISREVINGEDYDVTRNSKGEIVSKSII